MAAKRGGLGKGLDSLIPTSNGAGSAKKPVQKKSAAKEPEIKAEPQIVEKVVEKIVEKPIELKVKITKVGPNKEQPRKKFNEEALKELSDSIKQFGVIQPLLVQEKNGFYEIIAGERRWRAAKMAGLKEVPVIVKEYSDLEVVEIALIENLQREELNPIEEALAYRKLIDEFSLKQEDVAKRVSKSRTAVTNSMRLLKLGDEIQEMLVAGTLSTGHARTLLGLEDAEDQFAAAQKVVSENLSVRETEKLIKKMQKEKENLQKEKEKTPEDTELEAVYADLAEKMKGAVGTKVSITRKSGNKGRIEIEYYSTEDFERIYDLIMNAAK